MPLIDEIADVYAYEGDPAALVGEFRRTSVLVPVSDDGLMAAEMGGIRWLYAFTDEEALSRFALARGSSPQSEWQYVSALGARLLDVVVPAIDGPAGVALDAGSEQGMLFPPAPGIVPDAVAVRTDDNGQAPVPGSTAAPRSGGERI
ncbi:SseB family protein [Streptomyces rimosus]|uniref:SseB family protein n=1 Tax=Streptomyces rimosus TaxID=1927 RepID=UPI00067E48ED|nr:SseB family protein [Streptomyces rimosus]